MPLEDPGKKRRHRLALIACLAVVLVLMICCIVFHDQLTLDTILRYTPKRPVLAAVVLLALYALKSLSVFFPIYLLYAAGGILFPLPVAIAINALGTAVTLSVPYWLGRWGVARYLTRLVDKHPKAQRLCRMQQEQAFWSSFLLRIIACLPCDIVSLYMGSLRIPYLRYVAGGVVGFLPPVVALTVMGMSVTTPGSPVFLGALLGEIAIMAVSIPLYLRRLRRMTAGEEENTQTGV